MPVGKVFSLDSKSNRRAIPRAAVLSTLLLLMCASALSGLDKTVSLGKDNLWRGLSSADGVVLIPGEGGFPVLSLQTDEYLPNATTDLLLHFDGGSPTDSANHYRTVASEISTSRRWARLGDGAGVFQGERDAVRLAPSSPQALFEPGQAWHDFTIEFWLYPATLSEGETIFLWQGARKQGDTIVPQALRCDIENNRLTWTMSNLFAPPSGDRFSVSLQGADDLIPREWHHHTLRFNSRTGMIEYLIDGNPESIRYANDKDREDGTVFNPGIGSAAESQLTIGSGFTGFLDELRVSSTFVRQPNNYRYALRPGTAITDPIDLGSTDSIIKSISAVDRTPGNTGVFYFYRTANAKSGPRELSGNWIQFAPNKPLPSNPKGRFIQFKMELLPGGTGNYTPTVSDLSFSYQPRIPPPAPAFLTATSGNGTISLSWRKVVDPNLKGYKIFYGDHPHQYFGTDSSSGSSPIDVGNATSFDLKGLTNGKLYYFAVVAYDTSSPPHLSAFSNETAARPSALSGSAQ